jgi:hypothetical protein
LRASVATPPAPLRFRLAPATELGT